MDMKTIINYHTGTTFNYLSNVESNLINIISDPSPITPSIIDSNILSPKINYYGTIPSNINFQNIEIPQLKLSSPVKIDKVQTFFDEYCINNNLINKNKKLSQVNQSDAENTANKVSNKMPFYSQNINIHPNLNPNNNYPTNNNFKPGFTSNLFNNYDPNQTTYNIINQRFEGLPNNSSHFTRQIICPNDFNLYNNPNYYQSISYQYPQQNNTIPYPNVNNDYIWYNNSNFINNMPREDYLFNNNGAELLNNESKSLFNNHSTNLNSMNDEELANYSYILAKDQKGCRFLQKKLEEKTNFATDYLFKKVIKLLKKIRNRIVELIKDQFGNYLIQKLLDYLNSDMIMETLEIVIYIFHRFVLNFTIYVLILMEQELFKNY